MTSSRPSRESLVDAHVHWYPGVRLGDLLDRAFENLRAQRREDSEACCAVVLTLTARENDFEQLRRLALENRPVAAAHAPWRLRLTEEAASLAAERNGDRLWLIAGRQLVTSEGLELHAVGTGAAFEDGRPLNELADEIERAGALAVIPWGAGKWLGRRGRLLQNLLAAGAGPLLSESGIQPCGWPRSRLLRQAAAAGRVTLAGTDPLALPREEQRIGSFGIRLDGLLDARAPAADLVRRLRAPGAGVARFGRPQPLGRFLRTQWRLRRPATPLPGRETPDIETSSEDYASRFSGAAGAYFLDTQDQAVAEVMERLRGARVLEVGGGHGQLAGVLGRLGCTLTALGSDPVCHERMRARHPGAAISCVTGDVTRLPFADRSFEVVIAVRLLSHIERWPELLAEFCRVADKAVVLDYPSLFSLNALTPLLFALKKNVEKNTRTYLSFTRGELAREFGRQGFAIVAAQAQFFLPMFLHRALKAHPALTATERLARRIGLTGLLGSPLVIRAERRALP